MNGRPGDLDRAPHLPRKSERNITSHPPIKYQGCANRDDHLTSSMNHALLKSRVCSLLITLRAFPDRAEGCLLLASIWPCCSGSAAIVSVSRTFYRCDTDVSNDHILLTGTTSAFSAAPERLVRYGSMVFICPKPSDQVFLFPNKFGHSNLAGFSTHLEIRK